MNKSIDPKTATAISQKLRNEGKTIVLVGGCFDVLHSGHRQFLKKAKEQGDVLFVMLESDATIKQMKGENRPVNAQRTRARALAKIPLVDYIISLPSPMTHAQYDNLVFTLKPAIIATTTGDPYRMHKERQAKKMNARVVDVIERIPDLSTTKIVEKVSSFEI